MNILLYVIKSNRYFFAPPLGLAYIASSLLKNGHTVKIVDDYFYKKLRKEDIRRDIGVFKPEVVGFTTYSFSISQSFLVAQWIKEINRRTKIVFGGPHATHLPFETISNDFVDIVVKREGEITMAELVTALENNASLKGIKGIVYKESDDSVVDNGPRELIQDLDSMPFPAYDLLDMSKYTASPICKISNGKFGSIMTSRGCPYKCTFCCYQTVGGALRCRSLESILDELEILVGKYGITQLFFMDDTFTTNKQRAIALCELIQRSKLKICWYCYVRADHASEELFSAMRAAGCKEILIGAESGSQEMLNLLKKDITLEQIENAVKLGKKYFKNIVCTFVIGTPGDTYEYVHKTIKFAKKLNPDYIYFQIYIPMPGSEIFEEAVRSGIIDPKNFKCDSQMSPLRTIPAVNLSKIHSRDLLKLQNKAIHEFYLRPGYIFARLRKIRYINDIFRYLWGAWVVLTT